jgi:hypothetical protein
MADDDSPVQGRAAGGIARAAKLSGAQKSEIASKAASARWSNPIARNASRNKEIGVIVPPKPITPGQESNDCRMAC